MNTERLRGLLESAKEQAEAVYRETGRDYDAGRYEGLKQAIELLDEAERA